ncbi:MAG TPA: HlyD family efflux transporter periplasmic adaptor subunit [Armatimonadota bacterium]|nr:HlyD family efflux transporter periplasmic adaptor subunit [Armatimonadota bacterium]
MPKRRGVSIAVSAAVTVVVVGGLLATRRPWGARAGAAVTSGSGTIEATEVEVSAKIPGRLAQVLAREGDTVHKGDVIAVLDHGDLDAEVERAEGALASAEAFVKELRRGSRSQQIAAARARVAQTQAALNGARSQLSIAQASYDKSTELKQTVDQAQAQVASAEAALAAARARRDEALAGPRRQERQRADAERRRAQAGLEGAEAGARDAEELLRLQRDFTGPTTEAETAERTARLAVGIAEEQRRLVDEGARSQQVAQAESTLEAATIAYENARQRYARVKGLFEDKAATQQDYDDAKASLDGARARRDAAQAALADLRSGARPQERRSAALSVERASAAHAGAERGMDNARIAQEQAVLTAQMKAAAAQAERRAAQAALEAADATVDMVNEGTRPEQVAQAEAAVRQAEALLDGARTALANAKEARADRFLAQQQLETARTQLALAEAQQTAAQAELSLVMEGSTAEAIEAAEGQVRQAKGALDAARIRRQEAEVRAPCAGTVSDVVAEAGEVVAAGAAIVSMLDLEHMWLKVYLPVSQLHRVAVGDRATVRIDAEPRERIPGTVTAVARESEFTPKNVQTIEQRTRLVYWVKVGVGDGRGLLQPGMPADATFE